MILVVLNEPQELANIALVARAMMNFGLRDLRLVAPREYDPYRVEGIAHRSADLLARVRVLDRLEEALADCVHAAAFTARGRTARRNALRPREAAAELLALEPSGPVALVFGREDTGLTNEQLDLCHRAVSIPTDPGYPSLNLGHAVVVALYELALARGAGERPLKRPRRSAPQATVEQMEMMFTDFERTLETVGFFRNHVREGVMRTLREIGHRTPLDEREARLLRAAAIETRKSPEGRRGAPGPAET